MHAVIAQGHAAMTWPQPQMKPFFGSCLRFWDVILCINLRAKALCELSLSCDAMHGRRLLQRAVASLTRVWVLLSRLMCVGSFRLCLGR